MKARKIVFSRRCTPRSATCDADSSHPTSGNEPSSGKKGRINLPWEVTYSSGISVQGRLFLSFPGELLDYETLGVTAIYLCLLRTSSYIISRYLESRRFSPVNLGGSWNHFVELIMSHRWRGEHDVMGRRWSFLISGEVRLTRVYWYFCYHIPFLGQGQEPTGTWAKALSEWLGISAPSLSSGSVSFCAQAGGMWVEGWGRWGWWEIQAPRTPFTPHTGQPGMNL